MSTTTNPKVSIDDVLAAARDNGVDSEKIKQIEKDLRAAAEAEKADRAPVQKSKMQFICLVDDPEGKYAGQAFLGWVIQIEDSAPQMAAIDRVKAAGKAYNESRKGRKRPVRSIREVFSSVPRKFWKEEGKKTLPKCKEPIALIAVKGELE